MEVASDATRHYHCQSTLDELARRPRCELCYTLGLKDDQHLFTACPLMSPHKLEHYTSWSIALKLPVGEHSGVVCDSCLLPNMSGCDAVSIFSSFEGASCCMLMIICRGKAKATACGRSVSRAYSGR